MMRGELVTVAMQGDFGKPRPALIIQANRFSAHSSVTVLPLTGTSADIPLLRVAVKPCLENGLQKISYVMVDKATTLKRERIGAVFGRIDANTLLEVDRCLAVFLGIVK